MSDRNSIASSNGRNNPVLAGGQDYVTMTIADQLFGIPVLQVQDVLGPASTEDGNRDIGRRDRKIASSLERIACRMR